MPLRGLEAGGHPLLSTERGVPHISLVFREMWDTTALHVPLFKVGKKVKFRSLPHLAKNERDMGHPTIPRRERENPTLCGREKDIIRIISMIETAGGRSGSGYRATPAR